MRWTSSFRTTVTVSSLLSVACHGAAVAVALWALPIPLPSPPQPEPFRYGEYPVRIVWLPRPPEVEPPKPEPVREPQQDPAQPEKEEPPEAEPAREDVNEAGEAKAVEPSESETATDLQDEESDEIPRDPVSHRESTSKPVPEPPEEKTQVAETEQEQAPKVEPGVREQARLTQKLVPPYPRSCRRRGHEGAVLLECALDEKGQVLSVRVLESSGCDQLDLAALEAVRSAHFRAARLGGREVASTVILPVRFQLR